MDTGNGFQNIHRRYEREHCMHRVVCCTKRRQSSHGRKTIPYWYVCSRVQAGTTKRTYDYLKENIYAKAKSILGKPSITDQKTTNSINDNGRVYQGGRKSIEISQLFISKSSVKHIRLWYEMIQGPGKNRCRIPVQH